MAEIRLAGPSWSSKDGRSDISRYFAVSDLIEGQDIDMYGLKCSDLDPRYELKDLEPFDTYFENGVDLAGSISPIASAWIAKDTSDTAGRFPAICEILRQHRDCEYAIAALTGESATRRHDNNAKFEAAIENIRTEMASVYGRLLETASSSPFVDAFQLDQANNTCHPALVIPEMVEHILSYLNHGDLLRVPAVSKSFRNIIEESPKLRYRLGTRPDLSGDHHLLLGDQTASIVHSDFDYNHTGSPSSCGFWVSSHAEQASRLLAIDDYLLRCCQESLPPSDLADATISASLSTVSASLSIGATSKLRMIDAHYRSVLVAQPPVMQMSVSILHCFQGWRRTCEIDLPIADLLVEKGLSSERTVVKTKGAGLTVFDRQGPNWFEVHFEGTTRLRYDDPAILPIIDVYHGEETSADDGLDAEEKAHWARLRRAGVTHNKQLRGYTETMRQSKMQDRRFPTNEELEDAWSGVRRIIKTIADDEALDAAINTTIPWW